MNILYNLAVRAIRRTLEIPSRGFPKPHAWEPFDETFHVRTSGIVWCTSLRSENFIDGTRYEPCSPGGCEWAIANCGIDPQELAFIDIGCGKGRPLIIASQHNFAQLIGIDYSSKLCKIATANLKKLNISASIICTDAARFEFPERDIFAFFYHPFGPRVLNTVLDHLRCAKRIVVAYQGSGRDAVHEHTWLKSMGVMGDTELFRNFYP